MTLTWTAPRETTDGALVHKPGKMVVRRTVSDNSVPATVHELALPSAHKSGLAQPQSYPDALSGPLSSSTADFALYTVEALNSSGKSAGPSNQAAVPLVPVMPAPESVQVQPVEQGASISWKETRTLQNRTHLVTRYAYRVMRRAEGANQSTMLGQIEAGQEPLFVDKNIEWEKTYSYWITPVTLWENLGAQGPNTKGEVLGEDSQPVPITMRDVFPPASPVGLQAAFSGNLQRAFIDLSWTPNNEPDLAGYNVYRRAADESQFKKLNSGLVKAPAFQDKAVQPGGKYFYVVSAVDLRNNESPKSAEASEVVPRE